MKFPGDLPRNADVALDLARQQNPTISALMLEAEARDYELERVRGELLPTVSLEGRAQYGQDINGDPGKNDDDIGIKSKIYQFCHGDDKIA